jgi:hypothetical protein
MAAALESCAWAGTAQPQAAAMASTEAREIVFIVMVSWKPSCVSDTCP